MSFQVNLNISAGTTFSQQFTLTNPDLSPKNITGYKFQGYLAKHPGSVNAMTSTTNIPKHKYYSFNCSVYDGQKGIYDVYMSSKITSLLKEGKYVYNIVGQHPNGPVSQIVNGLAFVEKSFGSTRSENVEEIIFDGGGSDPDGDEIILNGGTSSGF